MKELSIEEKAKAYDEAYKKVAVRFGSNIADEIFLKESEGERIRKDIISFIEQAIDTGYGIISKERKEKWIAWLEKQGEQKPAWNEEDDIMVHDIDYALRCQITYPISKLQSMSNWLKNLKERVQPQNLTITDEELIQAKKDAYNDALDKIEYHSGEPSFDDGWSAAIWYLKKRNAQS